MKFKLVIYLAMVTTFSPLAQEVKNVEEENSLPEIFQNIANEWALTLENTFFEASKRTAKREKDYKLYIDEVVNLNDPQLVKNRTLEILKILQKEDDRFNEQVKLVQEKLTQLQLKEALVQKSIRKLETEKQALKETSDKYLNALYGTIFTIIIGLIALFNKFYIIRIEKNNLIADLKLKELDVKLKERELATPQQSGSQT